MLRSSGRCWILSSASDRVTGTEAYNDYVENYEEQQKRCDDLPTFSSRGDLEEMFSELFEWRILKKKLFEGWWILSVPGV
jgi:hypothetical protein